jgi:hypothetical protein
MPILVTDPASGALIGERFAWRLAGVNFRGEAVAGHAGFVPVGAIAVSAHTGEARMRQLRR